MRAIVTRFAPSPTGALHLGHAFAAWTAWRTAREAGGRFIVRIEDIDATRCKPEFEAAIFDDLAWLGLAWEVPVRRQSEHLADYRRALDSLERRGLLYPCFCTRAEIKVEIARAGAAPHLASESVEPVYPGTCRALSQGEREERRARGVPFALRLNLDAAMAVAGPLVWHDATRGSIEAKPELFGDVVLARKDLPTSYHLAVTLDDHLQGVTLVTRGVDLFEATHVQRLLQALLGLDMPDYAHHRLITDASGKRFAKRDRSATLASLRARGVAPGTIIEALETGSFESLR